jgi:hypothetical protein
MEKRKTCYLSTRGPTLQRQICRGSLRQFEGALVTELEHKTDSASSNSMAPTIDGDDHSFYAELTCPPGAFNIRCQFTPHFANLTGIRASTCSSAGLRVTGTGTVEAHGRSIRDPAPSHSWGYFSLDVSYDINVSHRTPITQKQILNTVLLKAPVSAPMPGGIGNPIAITIIMKRLGCSETFDSLGGDLPNPIVGVIPFTSTKGLFNAKISNQVLMVDPVITQ